MPNPPHGSRAVVINQAASSPAAMMRYCDDLLNGLLIYTLRQDQILVEKLQHHRASDRLGILSSIAGNHRPDGPETHHALTLNPDHPTLLVKVQAGYSAFTRPPDRLSNPIPEIPGHIMAQNATVYKIELSVADMDRSYYDTHKLTVAKHPSETDERLMVRIVAFALNAHENLAMTKGLSADDEPDIWQKGLSGELDVWVCLGLPSEKVMRQSCSKAERVIVYPYGGRTAEIWWEKIRSSTMRFDNLEVVMFSEKDTGELARLANRSMKLQINIQEGDVMVSAGDDIVYVSPVRWKSAA